MKTFKIKHSKITTFPYLKTKKNTDLYINYFNGEYQNSLM